MDGGLTAENLRQMPQPRHVSYPTRSADFFVTVNATVTGAASQTLWTPSPGRKFRLRGGELSATFTTRGTGAGICHLVLFRVGTASHVVSSLGALDCASPAGYMVANRAAIDLVEGVRGEALGDLLKVGATATIGSGEILVSGILWGTEVRN